MKNDKFVVCGGKKLFGEICVPKSKNAYLPILASCVLCSGEVTLHDCPNFDDIESMLDILSYLGAKIIRRNRTLHIDTKFISKCDVPFFLGNKIRSSVFLMGPILARMGNAKVCFPGGCNIGSRPIDLHLKGLSKLGAKIEEKYGFIYCKAERLDGSDIHLDYPSVGATENIMMCAVLSKGVTKIYNPAKEPEIVDLQNFINSAGGRIYGAGGDVITIEGVKSLHSTDFTPIGDRIVAGTYLLAACACGGDVMVKDVDYRHIYSLITKLQDSGFEITYNDDSIRVRAEHKGKAFGKLETLPYPGFPTDLQPQTLALACVSDGETVLVENLFETRLKHVPELVKMGADIVVKGNVAIVNGVEKLYGTNLYATDLRAGAALTISALSAEGESTIYDVYHVDRGYERLEESFSALGGDIRRVT